MTIPKTLFVSATPPGTIGVGEAFLREICLLIPRQSLSFLTMASYSYAMPYDSNDISDLDIDKAELPNEIVKAKSQTPLFKQYSQWSQRQAYWQQVNKLKEKIVSHARANKCEQIVAVLASPTITLIAEEVARELQVPLSCMVWDPPETTMGYLDFEPAMRNKVLDRFAGVLKFAKRVSVASEGMKEEYRTRFGIDGIPLIRPVRSDRVKTVRPVSPDQDSDNVIIGFSGSFYAADEFAALFNALSSVGWKIGGKQVIVKVYGNFVYLNKAFEEKGMCLKLLGYRDQLSTVDELWNCHLVYLPYWFDEKYSLSVRTCFPDKMGTYVASGVPILYHGPERSTPADFIRKFPVGLSCHSYKPADILQAIESLVHDQQLRESAWQARNQALEKQYSVEGFRESVARLFGVDASELLHSSQATTVSV